MRTILIAVPVEIVGIANAIAKAIDYDVGGDRSFDTISAADASGAEYAVTHAYCSDTLPEYLMELANSAPAALHAAVTAQYAARFPDDVIPSIENCGAFLAACKIVADSALDAGLESLGLSRVKP